MTLNSKKKFLKSIKKYAFSYLWELYKTAQTPIKWHKELFRFSKELGILCFSTPFDVDNVDQLEN